MALLSVLLLAAGTRVAAASAAEACLDGSQGAGECDDVGLLQQGVRSHAWKETDGSSPQSSAGAGEPKFTVYPYEQPQLWGTAYEGWEKCSGQQQSPINIQTWKCHETNRGSKLDTDYHGPDGGSPVYYDNNGHNFQVDGSYGSVTLDGVAYTSSQFHFHHPSEHRVNGKQADLEMHIVNTNAKGEIAVVGILFDIGKENECLAKIFAAPAALAGGSEKAGTVDIGECFEKQLSGPWWSYDGSLTTPPCTEGLLWNVMERRATISKEQVQVFKTRFEDNARPTQPLFGRKVTVHKV